MTIHEDRMFSLLKGKKKKEPIIERLEAIPERAVHKNIVEWLSWNLTDRAYFHTTENSNHTGGTAGMINQRNDRLRGVRTGFPDLIIIYETKDEISNLWESNILCLEIKRMGKKATDIQLAEHEKLRKAGADVEVVHSVDEMIAVVKKYNVPLKSK